MKKKVLTPEALALIVGGETPPLEITATETPVIEEVVATEEVVSTPTAEEITAPLIAAHTAAIEELNAGFAAERVALEASLAEVTASVAGLKEIVAGQVSRMRIGLKLAAVDMTTWTPAALVTEFENISDAFMKAIPVGSVVPQSTKEENKPEPLTSHDEAAFKALTF